MRPSEREDHLYENGKRVKILADEQRLLRQLDRRDFSLDGCNALDAGCGTGEISIELQRRGFHVVGIDFSSVAVEIAKKNGVDARHADLDSGIGFKDDSFDLIWMTDVLEHVFDPVLVIKEASRVLKPAGWLMVSIPNDLNWWNRVLTFTGQSYQQGTLKRYGQYKHHTFFSYGLAKWLFLSNCLKIFHYSHDSSLPKLGITLAEQGCFSRLFAREMFFVLKK